MDSFSNIPNHQKGEFMQFMEEQQMKESLRCETKIKIVLNLIINDWIYRMYNNVVENCFDKCITVGWDGVRGFLFC